MLLHSGARHGDSEWDFVSKPDKYDILNAIIDVRAGFSNGFVLCCIKR